MNVAFLGTGAMGKGIAKNILAAGHSLCVWNIQDACWNNALELQEMGAKACESLEDAVKQADAIGLSLTADAAIRSVCEQILPHINQNCILFDCSTISPDTSKQMAALFGTHNTKTV